MPSQLESHWAHNDDMEVGAGALVLMTEVAAAVVVVMLVVRLLLIGGSTVEGVTMQWDRKGIKSTRATKDDEEGETTNGGEESSMVDRLTGCRPAARLVGLKEQAKETEDWISISPVDQLIHSTRWDDEEEDDGEWRRWRRWRRMMNSPPTRPRMMGKRTEGQWSRGPEELRRRVRGREKMERDWQDWARWNRSNGRPMEETANAQSDRSLRRRKDEGG